MFGSNPQQNGCDHRNIAILTSLYSDKKWVAVLQAKKKRQKVRLSITLCFSTVIGNYTLHMYTQGV